ncbi:MAG: hypothetical protein J5654_12015 [Victivallales bacterium]|nr:hypothetical protein [Victivallales bacterium]
MFKRNVTLLLGVFALLATMSLTPVKGQARSSETLDVNRAIVNTELYLWNRFSDLLDVVRCGVALGPGLGFEVAITDYLNLGLYANCERGIAFPHFIPPFWLVDYYEHNTGVFVPHGGTYATAAIGPWRAETGKGQIGTETKHFARDRWDIRVQLDAILIICISPSAPLRSSTSSLASWGMISVWTTRSWTASRIAALPISSAAACPIFSSV